MGLLDDAIREHLDLKRRRGADPAEIERAEREALGPVRRGPEFPAENVAPDEIGQSEAEELAERPEGWEPFDEDEELRALEDEEASPYPPPHGPEGDPLMEDEQVHPPRPGSAPPPHPADLAPAADPDRDLPPHPADPPPTPADQHLERETEEYELEPADDSDVLESTPEFLQDAPEHDRLWFEQRPPRDFDFDG
jgi:hypothetical protein